MKTFEELISDDPSIDMIREWVANSKNSCELLTPSTVRKSVLLEVQVTTHSSMGAIAYETGGLLLEDGWLRFLGSGHPKLSRTLPGWNREKSQGFYLFADDAVGGFFALNGGALGGDPGNVYYWPPDDLDWEPLDLGYTDFLFWSLTESMADFYKDLRWKSWQDDLAAISADQCFMFYPFLWSSEGSANDSHRGVVSIEESYTLKIDMLKQLGA